MIIEINDDMADTIVQNALVNDYVNLTKDLKTPENMHEDDVAAYKETVQALGVLAKWYFVGDDFVRAVKKARKAK